MNDEGSVHVFEAIITGMLVLTAILFMTALSKPDAAEAAGTIDLARMADDTLAILAARPADDPAFDSRLEEIVDAAIRGGDSGDQDLRDVLPIGTRYVLRLDNGVEPLHLLPAGSGPTLVPRDADAAETFVVMDWNAHPAGVPTNVGPAEALDFSAWSALSAPTGGAIAPDGGTWLSWWQQREPGMDRVPAAAPYGIWLVDGVSTVLVHAPGVSSVPTNPVYGVQLVVWPGA